MVAAAAFIVMSAGPSAFTDDQCRQSGVATALDSGETQNAGRTRHHNDPVIHLALAVIGQPVDPVELISSPEIGAIFTRLQAGAPPTGLNAFRPRVGSLEPIYVNRDSAVYRSAAGRRSALALLQLAATIVHEQVHNSDGEHAAYRVQSDFVRSRLHSLPARQQAQARQYLRALDSRAYSRGHVERVLRERRSAESRDGQSRPATTGRAGDRAASTLQKCRTK